ncbi:hypothetical protein ACMSI6_21935 [Pseudomonas antarctica]|uniref:hypothetical protein n=1 Tax=Pseudomonas antarctica TaxID=219572 RepID=UPI0039C40901
MKKVVPDPPRNSAKDRAAFNRAIDHYLPTQGVQIEDLSFEDALLYTASLLDSASATADRSIECLKPPKHQPE